MPVESSKLLLTAPPPPSVIVSATGRLARSPGSLTLAQEFSRGPDSHPDREEEQAGADREERWEDTDDQPGHRQHEGGDGCQVHELVLQVMTGKNLPDPVLKPGPAGRPARIGRGGPGRRRFIRLRFAAESAEAGIVLDLLAALTTKHPGPLSAGSRRLYSGPIIKGSPSANHPRAIRPVTKYARAPLQPMRLAGEIMQWALSVFFYNRCRRFLTAAAAV